MRKTHLGPCRGALAPVPGSASASDGAGVVIRPPGDGVRCGVCCSGPCPRGNGLSTPSRRYENPRSRLPAVPTPVMTMSTAREGPASPAARLEQARRSAVHDGDLGHRLPTGLSPRFSEAVGQLPFMTARDRIRAPAIGHTHWITPTRRARGNVAGPAPRRTWPLPRPVPELARRDTGKRPCGRLPLSLHDSTRQSPQRAFQP